MIAEYAIYLTYASKILISIKSMFTKPAGLLLLVPTAVAVPLFSTMQQVLLLLIGLFALDFVTGLLASYVEKREREESDPELKKQNLISSQKLKLSGVKAFMYCSVILSVYWVERIFFVKPVKFENFSDQDLTFTVIAAACLCGIEFYSIFFENFKRMGFDIVGWFKKIVGTAKDIKDTITDFKSPE